MSVDVQGLRSSIQNIQKQIGLLEAEVARLRHIADDAEGPNGAGAAVPVVELPPEIVISQPEAVDGYLRAHPGLVDLIRDIGSALVEEFQGERSEIELTLYQDPEIDDRYLTLYVRVPCYEDNFMDRLRALCAPFDERRAQTEGWVLVTSDFESVE